MNAPAPLPTAPSSGSAAPAAGAQSYCVFRLASGLLAIDARLVGEVAMIEGLTHLPGCHPAVIGLANLRGRALAVIDLGPVLGDGAPPVPTEGALRVLVLRLPGREAGVAVERIEGVFTADPALRRSANRLTEPRWLAAFQTFVQGGASQVAAIIDPDELAARLDQLRFATRRPAAVADG